MFLNAWFVFYPLQRNAMDLEILHLEANVQRLQSRFDLLLRNVDIREDLKDIMPPDEALSTEKPDENENDESHEY